MGPEPGTRRDLRDTILEAARRVIDEQGLQAATTRRIAEVAGCAEGTIYRHFEDKHELFHELLAASAPNFLPLVAKLPGLAGQGTVRATLGEFGVAALQFFRAVLPFVGGSIVDPELREQQRLRFNARDRGPVHSLEQLEGYLRAEAELGRLGSGLPFSGAAAALLGAVFSKAYLDVWLGPEVLGALPDEDFVAGVVDTLLQGLLPRRS